MRFSHGQLENALSPTAMSLDPGWNVNETKPQPQKQSFPMVLTLLGSINLVKDRAEKNASSSIRCNLESGENDTLERSAHS
jgi:hypothetical protein